MSGAERAATPIVALDVPDAAAAEALVARLGQSCDWYKVGLELYAAEGPAIVGRLRALGKRVFVDLKLHDIPNTVRGAARSVARTGASLLTVHAIGGRAMIAAAVAGAAEGAADGGVADGAPPAEPCAVLAVTVLTSMDAAAIAAATGRPAVDVSAEVRRLAAIADRAGAAGVVCSGHEAAAVRAATGDRLGCLVPGIRLAGSARDDQARVTTPGAAVAAGARWLILGRTVTAAADPVEAMARVHAEIAGAASAADGR